MDKKLISFIVPVFNCEDYLTQCFNSLLEQTNKNFELIVINDGSTDNSLHLINEYAKKFDSFTLIDQTNSGLSFSRNVGMQKAKGKYIAFLDADDYVSSEFVDKISKEIKNKPDIIRFNYFIFDKLNNFEKKDDGKIQKADIKSLILNDQIGNQVWRNVYKKELIQNLYFSDGCIWEDLLWTYLPFYNANFISLIDDYLYCYRKNEKGISCSTNPKKSTNAIFHAFETRLQFAEKNNLYGNYTFLLEKTFRCAVNSLLYQDKKTYEYISAKTFIKVNKKLKFFTIKFFVVYHFNWLVKIYLRIRKL